jgi:hypothetical protein
MGSTRAHLLLTCLFWLAALTLAANAVHANQDPLDEFAYLLNLPMPDKRWHGLVSINNTGTEQQRDRERLYLHRPLGSQQQGELRADLEADSALDYLSSQLAIEWPTPWQHWQWQAKFAYSENRFKLDTDGTTLRDDQQQWQLGVSHLQASRQGYREWQIWLRQLTTETTQAGLTGSLNQHRHTLPGAAFTQHRKALWGSHTTQLSLLYHSNQLSTVKDLALSNVARLELPKRFWLLDLHSQWRYQPRWSDSWRAQQWRGAIGLQTSFGTRLLPVFQTPLDSNQVMRCAPVVLCFLTWAGCAPGRPT